MLALVAVVGPGGVGLHGEREQPTEDEDGQDQPEIDQHLLAELLVLDRLAGQAQGPDDAGVVRLLQLQAQDLDEEDVADHLQAAARAARAAPDEHQHQQRAPGEAVPAVEVVGAEPGGGHDRGDLEEAVAASPSHGQPPAFLFIVFDALAVCLLAGRRVGSLLHACPVEVVMPQAEADHHGRDRQDDRHVGPPLEVAEELAGPADQDEVHQHEVRARQQHEHRNRHLDQRAVVSGVGGEVADAGVVGAETPGGHRAEGVAQGVERRQVLQEQQHGQRRVQADVHEEQDPGGVLHAGLGAGVAGTGHLRPHQRLARRTLTQDHHEQHDDPQAAEEVRAGSPEEDAPRHQRRLLGIVRHLQVGQHRGAGSAETRLGLEHGVHHRHGDPRVLLDGAAGAAETERQGAQHGGQDPAQPDHGHGLLAE